MQKLFFSGILIVLINISYAQKKEKTIHRIYCCDTTSEIFMEKVKPKVLEIKKQKPVTFFNVYVGDSYYTPAYSFCYWKTNNRVKNNLQISANDSIVNNNSDSIIFNKISLARIEKTIVKVSCVNCDTSISISHDFILSFEIMTGNKKYKKYRICYTQLVNNHNGTEVIELKYLLNKLKTVTELRQKLLPTVISNL